MRIIGFAALLMLALASGISSADELSEATTPSIVWKTKAHPPIPLSVLSDMPGASAGCLVIGYHILKDGSVARQRVMQGAYTVDVPAPAQQVFAEAALKTMAGWSFEADHANAQPMFGWTAVGFAPSDGHSSPVIGTDQQDVRVRTACEIKDMVAWSERNAFPLDSPEVVRDGRIFAVPPEQPRAAFWVMTGQFIPPVYPPAAARAGVDGCVVVGFVVGNDGKTDQFRVMKSRPNGSVNGPAAKGLENAAIYAASKWRFSPGPDNPRRMPALLQIPVDFSLGGSSAGRPCNPVEISKKP